MNILYFRFANSFLEPSGIATIWPVSRSPSPRISALGSAGIYETAGCLRDVIENHLFKSSRSCHGTAVG